MQLRQMQTDAIALSGGLDLSTIPANVKPGSLLSCINFEPDTNGGYKKMRGIERYDGHSRPSDATYYYAEVTVTGSVAVGDTITGVSSGATAKIIVVPSASVIIVTRYTASPAFTAGETFNVSGSPQGTISIIEETAEASLYNDAVYLQAAMDDYRADISEVPGSGYVRGVKYYDGTVYAFRDNAGGTQCVMYEATASGWSAITFGREIQFTGAVGEIFEGNTVTGQTSGVTGVVQRALLRTGTWTVSGVGTLVFDSVSGNFINGENLRVGGVTKAVANGADTAITLQPGGKFEFRVVNFYGADGSQRLYCVDGVNYLGEFDGTRWVPIRTGIGDDNPKYLEEHRKHLIVALESECAVSGTGEPYSWTPLTGAAQIATGETITGLSAEVGDPSTGSLLVLTDDKTFMIYGNDRTDFYLVLHSPRSGGRPYTVQNIGISHYMGPRGITQLIASQAFGNFQLAVLSNKIQPLLNLKRNMETASCVVRDSNQYRIFFNDGTGVMCRVLQNSNSTTPSISDFMTFDYQDIVINQVDSVIDASGEERIFAAGQDGYVYELDRGTSLDGEDMRFHLKIAFNHSKGLRIRKNYNRAVFQIQAEGYASMGLDYALGFGNTNIGDGELSSKTILGGGNFWDVPTDQIITWDTAYVQEINAYTPGNGDSISINIAGEDAITAPFTLQTCILYYKINRQER